jgi:hypothetical protein
MAAKRQESCPSLYVLLRIGEYWGLVQESARRLATERSLPSQEAGDGRVIWREDSASLFCPA